MFTVVKFYYLTNRKSISISVKSGQKSVWWIFTTFDSLFRTSWGVKKLTLRVRKSVISTVVTQFIELRCHPPSISYGTLDTPIQNKWMDFHWVERKLGTRARPLKMSEIGLYSSTDHFLFRASMQCMPPAGRFPMTFINSK